MDWIHQLGEPVGSPHEGKFCRRRRLVKNMDASVTDVFLVGLAILWATESSSSDAKGSVEFCEV
jgi:hypothetical protein